MSDNIIVCAKCYYNFDGVCANHTPEPEADQYGKPCNDLMGCVYVRLLPAFLSEQTQEDNTDK